MANSTYFPIDKHAQADWYTNMTVNFPPLADTLGFSTTDANAWMADCAYAAFVLDGLTGPVTAFAQAVTGYANTMIAGPADPPASLPAALLWPPPGIPTAVTPGIDGRRQQAVDQIKKSASYTPLVIGKTLRTENTGDPFSPDTYVAQIRSLHLNGQGQVVAAFSKAGGHIDEVNLYCQRAGDAAPVKVGMFTHTPAIDTTPLKVPGTPEQRAYTVMAVIADREIGMRSAAVTILVS